MSDGLLIVGAWWSQAGKGVILLIGPAALWFTRLWIISVDVVPVSTLPTTRLRRLFSAGGSGALAPMEVHFFLILRSW
jgi:hypothetical protein